MSTTIVDPVDLVDEVALRTGGGPGDGKGGGGVEDEIEVREAAEAEGAAEVGEVVKVEEVAEAEGVVKVEEVAEVAEAEEAVKAEEAAEVEDAAPATAAPVDDKTKALHAVSSAAAATYDETKTFHTVAAAAAAAFADAGYATSVDLKLHMRQHMRPTDDRDGFAEILQKFGAGCAVTSTVGIAVVSTTESTVEAWLFEAQGSDDSALRSVLAEDAKSPSLLLRQVNMEEDYLASHAHGSAIGIDPTEGVAGIRLPDGEEVPRFSLGEK